MHQITQRSYSEYKISIGNHISYSAAYIVYFNVIKLINASVHAANITSPLHLVAAAIDRDVLVVLNLIKEHARYNRPGREPFLKPSHARHLQNSK